jgi:hypothetical protein
MHTTDPIRFTTAEEDRRIAAEVAREATLKRGWHAVKEYAPDLRKPGKGRWRWYVSWFIQTGLECDSAALVMHTRGDAVDLAKQLNFHKAIPSFFS